MEERVDTSSNTEEFLKSFLNTKKLTTDEYLLAKGLPQLILANLQQADDPLQSLKELLGSENYVRKEYCWPDGVFRHNVVVNDVSQLNPTRVSGIYQVRTIEDIQKIIKHAEGKQIGIRGTKHSMGGQSICQHGIIIDMQYVDHMQFHKDSNTVTVGTGTTWAALIKYLNQFGRSPRTLQSYCSFSIGGTLSVNGHGITTDFTVSESVVKFKLIRASGAVVECSRESEGEEKELFKLCIGGYGLFGIIYEVTLKVDNNSALWMDTATVSVDSFRLTYDGVLNNPDVDMKLARIDTTTFETIDLFVFSRDCETPTVSSLPVKPKEMGKISGMIYKWIAAPLRELRFMLERNMGVALDWGEVSDRNEMLYESAAPLARLYSPLIMVDDTFILQEYFIPKPAFGSFMPAAKDIVINKINKESIITLMNITIRFVHQDTDTHLSYANHKDGMFAFVLYYRIRRTEEADKLLETYHQMFVDATLRVNGTFYLPYRHHFTPEQLRTAYPQFDEFKEKKQKYDPANLFGNLWWDKYGDGVPENRNHLSEAISFPEGENTEIRNIELRRTDSFVKLVKNPSLRFQFKELFLTEVFNLTSPNLIWKMVNTAIWQSPSGKDCDIYRLLFDLFQEYNTGLAQVTGAWSAISQFAEQKKELVRETISIIARTGQLGKIHTYCSIGDYGKLVLPLKKALKMNGNAYIINNQDTTDKNFTEILERGEIRAEDVGIFECLDFESICAPKNIENGSCDLVTMNQGLHHIHPDNIPAFLKVVYDILRPGGLFIVREHDLDDENLLPMLDCAHMVFNAVTGVPPRREEDEKRGFRSIIEWRKIIESAGFEDSMVYEMQPNDPTVDIMMCFFKPPRSAELSCVPLDKLHRSALLEKELESSVPQLFKVLDNAPQFTLNVGIRLVESLIEGIPILRDTLLPILCNLLPKDLNLEIPLQAKVNSFFDFILKLLNRFQPLTSAAVPIPSSDDRDLIPNEVFLLLNALRVRARSDMLAAMVVGYIDRGIEAMVTMFSSDTAPMNTEGTNQCNKPTKQEVDEVFENLFCAVPSLRDIPLTIRQMGLPDRISNIMLRNVKGIEELKTWIMKNMDENAWKKLQNACKSIQEKKTTPHIDRILKREDPWNSFALAILGCPNLQLNTMRRLLIQGVGLGNLLDLYNEAQQKRKSEQLESKSEISPAALTSLNNICEMKTYKGDLRDIPEVLCVVSATYEASSLFNAVVNVYTSTQDVTKEVRELLNSETGVLRLSEYQETGAARVVRGTKIMTVLYRSIPAADKFVQLDFSEFTRQLAAEGVIDGSSRAKNGQFTWYKLPEWLQVEIVQLFGNSMEHTPWYRFPFMKILKLYFDVFVQEFNIVLENYGKPGAIFNSGFLTDAIPMVVMGILFGQMSALAYPLQYIAGKAYNEDALVEQLVIMANSNTNWTDFKDFIKRTREITPGIWVVYVKTFKPFTEFLIKFADKAKAAKIIEISNQNVVQMKVEITNDDQIQEIKQIHGCAVKFDFQFPAIGKATYLKQVSVKVEVPCLLDAIRSCVKKGITVVQVYDFYG